MTLPDISPLYSLAGVLVGSVPGIVARSPVATRIPDRILRPILAGPLTLVGGKPAF